MTARLATDPAHHDFERGIRRTCTACYQAEGEEQVRPFDHRLWAQLGELGVWGVGTSGGGGPEIVVAAEALGAEAIAGPVSPTFFALPLPGDHARSGIDLGQAPAAAAAGNEHPLPARKP